MAGNDSALGGVVRVDASSSSDASSDAAHASSPALLWNAVAGVERRSVSRNADGRPLLTRSPPSSHGAHHRRTARGNGRHSVGRVVLGQLPERLDPLGLGELHPFGTRNVGAKDELDDERPEGELIVGRGYQLVPEGGEAGLHEGLEGDLEGVLLGDGLVVVQEGEVVSLGDELAVGNALMIDVVDERGVDDGELGERIGRDVERGRLLIPPVLPHVEVELPLVEAAAGAGATTAAAVHLHLRRRRRRRCLVHLLLRVRVGARRRRGVHGIPPALLLLRLRLLLALVSSSSSSSAPRMVRLGAAPPSRVQVRHAPDGLGQLRMVDVNGRDGRVARRVAARRLGQGSIHAVFVAADAPRRIPPHKLGAHFPAASSASASAEVVLPHLVGRLLALLHHVDELVGAGRDVGGVLEPVVLAVSVHGTDGPDVLSYLRPARGRQDDVGGGREVFLGEEVERSAAPAQVFVLAPPDVAASAAAAAALAAAEPPPPAEATRRRRRRRRPPSSSGSSVGASAAAAPRSQPELRRRVPHGPLPPLRRILALPLQDDLGESILEDRTELLHGLVEVGRGEYVPVVVLQESDGRPRLIGEGLGHFRGE
mmetsp:Transcript_9662/g.18287  ORF Transcript_9662/g.18287 Transcript_9662/m.18287 type:complete len:597 (-) Transcript_9662:1370-3160(-)